MAEVKSKIPARRRKRGAKIEADLTPVGDIIPRFHILRENKKKTKMNDPCIYSVFSLVTITDSEFVPTTLLSPPSTLEDL